MRSDIFFRNAAFAAGVLCFAAAGDLAGAALGASATGAGAAAAALAALIAAHRFLVPSIIALRPAALNLRFAGAFGVESSSTDGDTACGTGPGFFSVVTEP